MVYTLFNLVLSTLVLFACLAFGRSLLSRLDFRYESLSEEIILATGLGLACLIYALVLLGVVRLLYPATAWTLLIGGAFVGSLWLRNQPPRIRPYIPRVRTLQPELWAVAAMLLTYMGVYAVTALSPTLEGDSTAGYLLVAREYAVRHALEPVDYAYVTSYPQNGQMLSTLGFLLSGQILAQLLVSFTMGLLCLGVIYVMGRTYFSCQAALVGMTIWYGTYSVAYLNASSKIDLAWAAFDLLALLAFSRWYFAQSGERHWHWLMLAGFFLGVAGGVKQASVFTAIALSIAVAMRLWQDRQRRLEAWVGAYLALGVPTTLAALWVVRTYLMTGGLGFTGAGLRGDSGLAGFFRTLWQMSMLGNAVSIEGPLGKPVGPTLLATLPLLVLLRRVHRRVWHMLAFSGLMILLWFQGVQRARHLLPTLAVLALLAGYVVVRLLAERRWLGQVVVAAMLLALAINLGLWSYIHLIGIQRIPYVLGLHDRDRYLAVNLSETGWYPHYPILRYIWDHLSPDARIAALSTGNSYYVDRPFYAGWSQGPDDDPGAQGLLRALEAQDITHVFVNDYVVEIRNYQNAWLLRPEFQARHLTKLICASDQCLYAISNTQASTANER